MTAQSSRALTRVPMPLPDNIEASVAESPVLVRFEGVHKTYDERSWVVDNLDLNIRQGEFLSLLGPSGSGKTTTVSYTHLTLPTKA